MKFIKKHRNIYLRIMDIIIIAISYYVAQVIIGNQLVLQHEIGKKLITTIIMAIIIYGGILELFKTYKNITRYENGNDYLIYVLACLISCTIMIFFNVIPVVPILDERTNLIASLIIVTSIIGYRVFIRLILNEGTTSKREKEDTRKNVLVIGAGEATKILLTTIIGVISTITFVTLLLVVCFYTDVITLPIKIVLMIIALSVFGVGLYVAMWGDRKIGYFKCRNCNELFTPTFMQYNMGIHLLSTRYLKCPHCKTRTWCRKVMTKE